MNKQFPILDDKGREISKGQIAEMLAGMLAPKNLPIKCEPPKNLQEFEDRLMNYCLEVNESSFGLDHEILPGKILKKEDMGTDLMVKVLQELEKRESVVSNRVIDTYSFLKGVLEKDASLFGKDVYLIGLNRDRSGISEPKKNQIAVQAASQIGWFLDGTECNSIEKMTTRLLKKEEPLHVLLELERFNDRRTITNWINPMFPVPRQERKKKLHHRDFSNLLMIPGIYTEKGVSFPRLRFALICLTRILKMFHWEVPKILESQFVQILSDRLQWYPKSYVKEWVIEAFSTNCRIFDT